MRWGSSLLFTALILWAQGVSARAERLPNIPVEQISTRVRSGQLIVATVTSQSYDRSGVSVRFAEGRSDKFMFVTGMDILAFAGEYCEPSSIRWSDSRSGAHPSVLCNLR